MKKVFVTTCAVVFAAVAAGAQGLGTVRDINGFGAEYLSRQSKAAKQQTIKKEKQQVGSLEKAIEQANVKHNREMFALGSLGDATVYAQYAPASAPQPVATAGTATVRTQAVVPQKKARVSSYNPYVYAGREGKVIALGEAMVAGLKARKEARKRAKQAEQAEKKANKEKKEGSWLGALFGGRYPGESQEDYELRIKMSSHPACQPFK